jgi:Protein of unknown function (DUF1549)/Protein of unknown function (DUF1553)/Planctomycete cytochrome C
MNATAGDRDLTRLGRLVLIAFLICASSPGQTPGVAYFETKIRPLFASKCQGCHGAAARMAGLDLSSAAGFQKGADSGPLVSVSDPNESRLMRAIGYEGAIKMPPSGKLREDEIAALREWVRMGSPWPAETRKPLSDLNEQRKFWSFQPVHKVAPPEVRNKAWVRSPIDAFILAKLEEKHLQPAPAADKLTLLRRATYDLTGLPPTEIEIRNFLEDNSPEAFARVVDRLIKSPRYGERWGRHWMDVARYADSTGADEDHRYPYAWRYRDYVIEAFNRDEPYDQFVREQIAGDLLPAENGADVNVRGIVATGFLALGPKLIAEQDKKKMLYDMVDEEIDVASRAFLGLTIACARCHDHKFDPISTNDYYGLAAILVSSKQLAKIEGTVSELYFAPLVSKDVAGRYEAHQIRIKDKQKEIDDLLAEEGARYRDALAPRLADYMLTARRVYQDGAGAAEAATERKLDASIVEKWVAYLKPTNERRAHLELWYQAEAASGEAAAGEYQKRFIATATLRREAMAKWKQESLAAKAAGKEAPPAPKFPAGVDRFFTEVAFGKGPFALPEKDRDKVISENGRTRLAPLEGDLKNLKTSGPPEPPLACALSEGTVIDQKVFIRGNPENQGEAAPKRFPLILASIRQAPIAKGSGRRELADWLAGVTNPLPARVMANRIWEWHFGEGIVRTPSNFGKMGERPTHPELLDYLAARFVEGGWSVKSMHRMLMLSSAYQMSSAPSPEALSGDADDSLLSRFPQRRLEVEEIRDSLLALDGSLDLTMGGALQSGHGTDKEFSDERMSLNPDQSKRRTVYLPLRRSNLPSVLTLFDFGDATSPGEGRSQTNVAPQALYMMNSEFVARQAGSLAKELLSDVALDDAGRIRQAYYRAQSRPPQEEEVRSALEYIRHFPGKHNTPEQGRMLAWTSFCRTLVASNDFLYVH